MSDRHDRWTGQEMLFARSRKGRQGAALMLPPLPHCANCRRVMTLADGRSLLPAVCYHCGGTQLATTADYQRWGIEAMIEGNKKWEKKQEKINWRRIMDAARLRYAAQRKRPPVAGKKKPHLRLVPKKKNPRWLKGGDPYRRADLWIVLAFDFKTKRAKYLGRKTWGNYLAAVRYGSKKDALLDARQWKAVKNEIIAVTKAKHSIEKIAQMIKRKLPEYIAASG